MDAVVFLFYFYYFAIEVYELFWLHGWRHYFQGEDSIRNYLQLLNLVLYATCLACRRLGSSAVPAPLDSLGRAFLNFRPAVRYYRVATSVQVREPV